MAGKPSSTKKSKREIYDAFMSVLGSRRSITPSEMASSFWADGVEPSKCKWYLEKMGFKFKSVKEGRNVTRYDVLEIPPPPEVTPRKTRASAAPKQVAKAAKALAPAKVASPKKTVVKKASTTTAKKKAGGSRKKKKDTPPVMDANSKDGAAGETLLDDDDAPTAPAAASDTLPSFMTKGHGPDE